MNDALIAKIKERYDSLPAPLQNMLASTSYRENLLEIQQKHHLTIEQLGTFEMETSMVLLGITTMKEYAAELHEQLHITESAAQAILADVNEKVFKEVRLILQKIDEVSSADTAAEQKREVIVEKEVLQKSGIEIEQAPAQTAGLSRTAPAPASIGGSTEATILQRSGIEVEPDAPATLRATLPQTNASRADILATIENPPKSTSTFLEQKMNNHFSIPKKESEHTVGNVSANTQGAAPMPQAPMGPKRGDPYRERIEP